MGFGRFFVGLFLVVVVQGISAEPTAERVWTSDAGTKLTASALELRGDTVIFKSSDGRQIDVPLARLVAADQATLSDHFQRENDTVEQTADEDTETAETEKIAKEDITGEVRENIKAGDWGRITAYIPSSVQEGDKRPAFCYVEMRKPDLKTLDKLKAGSEVTGWLIVLNLEMGGEVLEEYVDRLGQGWLETMKTELPIDVERLYGAAYSSGVKGLMQLRKIMGGYDGILTVSGIFSKGDSGLPVCYGMIGLGSASRVNFTKNFEKNAGRGSLIRYTADGKGDASEDGYEDGMIYLAIHYYSDDGARKPEELTGFVDRLLARIETVSTTDPERAYMWIMQSERLKKNSAQQAKWVALQTKLEAIDRCVAYGKGFEMFEDLGYKVITDAQSSVDEKANKKIQRELDRMKEELKDTSWIQVIESFSVGG